MVPGKPRATNGATGPEPNRMRTVTSSVVGPGLNTSMDDDPPVTPALCGMVHPSSVRGEPGTMVNPDPSPDKQLQLARHQAAGAGHDGGRDIRLVLDERGDALPCIWPGPTTMPWKLMGCRGPVGVTNPRSTTSGVDVGLKRATNRASEPVVTPLGKNHCRDVALWHGDSDQPDGPSVAWVTATPPPESVTASEIQAPVWGPGWRRSVWLRAGTDTPTSTLAPVSVTASMVPDTEREPVLVKITEPGASCPAAVDWPVQYHAEDSASAALTAAADAGGGPPGEALPGERPATASPTSTAATSVSTSHRRLPA